jgi:hypothetical protein
LVVAKANGIKVASDFIEMARKNMNASQIEKGQQMANEILARLGH